MTSLAKGLILVINNSEYIDLKWNVGFEENDNIGVVYESRNLNCGDYGFVIRNDWQNKEKTVNLVIKRITFKNDSNSLGMKSFLIIYEIVFNYI